MTPKLPSKQITHFLIVGSASERQQNSITPMQFSCSHLEWGLGVWMYATLLVSDNRGCFRLTLVKTLELNCSSTGNIVNNGRIALSSGDKIQTQAYTSMGKTE